MVAGTKLWSGLIPLHMKEMQVSDSRSVQTYQELPEHLYAALRATAARWPDKTAVSDDFGHEATYSELLSKTDRFSAYLYRHAGVRKGSHVAMMLYNSLEFGVAFLAINKLGAVAVPLQTKYREPEILALLEKADIDCIISDRAFQNWFASFSGKGIPVLVCRDLHEGYGFSAMEDDETEMGIAPGGALDTTLLIFTSGTTSRSKGVVIKNYNIMHAILSYEKTLRITSDDVTVIPVPMYLVTGLVALFGLFVRVGGTIYIQQFFHADKVLSCVRDHHVTFIHASPTVFSLLLGEAENYPELPSLVKFACGSSNMPKEKIRQLHDWLPQSAFHTVYGLTETTSPGTIFPSDAALSPHIGSSGIPIPGTCFRILAEDGSELPPGSVGEIFVTGANILDSYYKMDTPLWKDNWLDTGDLGYFSQDGYLYIVDRRKDMINRGGEKICSFDVENEIYMIDGVLEAAVVGIPDEMYGEIPAAAIKTVPGFALTEDGIRRYLKTRLASYQVPARILFLDEIPLTPNGKVDKKFIRTLFQ